MKKLKPIYLIILAFVLLWGVIFGRWALRFLEGWVTNQPTGNFAHARLFIF